MYILTVLIDDNVEIIYKKSKEDLFKFTYDYFFKGGRLKHTLEDVDSLIGWFLGDMEDTVMTGKYSTLKTSIAEFKVLKVVEVLV